MSQINQDKIERLNFDADEIIRLSENFFSSILIQREKQIVSTGSPIPAFDGGYQNTGSNYIISYSWSKLSTELSELQIELLRKYDLWYENSSFLIRKFLSDRLDAFDESYKNGREYITLNCSPIDKQSIKSFYKFKQHFNIQRNILSLIFSVVEDEKTNKKIIQEVQINEKWKKSSIKNALEKIKAFREKRNDKTPNEKERAWHKDPKIIVPSLLMISLFLIGLSWPYIQDELWSEHPDTYVYLYGREKSYALGEFEVADVQIIPPTQHPNQHVPLKGWPWEYTKDDKFYTVVVQNRGDAIAKNIKIEIFFHPNFIKNLQINNNERVKILSGGINGTMVIFEVDELLPNESQDIDILIHGKTVKSLKAWSETEGNINNLYIHEIVIKPLS